MTAGPNLPEDIGTQLAEIDRRLRALESAPRMTNTAQEGGTYRLISPSTEDDMMRFGEFGDGAGSFFGLVMYDGDNHSMVMTRDDKPGLIKPGLHLPWSRASAFDAITSAGYTVVHRSNVRKLYHDTLWVELPVTSDVGTTGSIRIREFNSGAVTDAAVTTANSAQLVIFKWLHGFTLGDDGGSAAEFLIEAKRDGGGGNINVYEARRAELMSSVLTSGAAANGNPTLI